MAVQNLRHPGPVAKLHTLTKTMDNHALAVLATAESWEWPPLKRRIQQSGVDQGDKFQALITPKILSGFIEASQTYPHSQLVDHFWLNFQRGHAGLQKNSELLLVWSLRKLYITSNYLS